MIKFITIAAFTAAASLTAIPALADTVVQTKAVSYADLDLSNSAAQAKMRTRINAAAREVCGYDADTRDLGQMHSQNACVIAAKQNAQVKLAAAIETFKPTQRLAVTERVDRNVPGHAR